MFQYCSIGVIDQIRKLTKILRGQKLRQKKKSQKKQRPVPVPFRKTKITCAQEKLRLPSLPKSPPPVPALPARFQKRKAKPMVAPLVPPLPSSRPKKAIFSTLRVVCPKATTGRYPPGCVPPKTPPPPTPTPRGH